MKTTIGDTVRKELAEIERVEAVLDDHWVQYALLVLHERFHSKAEDFITEHWRYEDLRIKSVSTDEVLLEVGTGLPYFVDYELIADRINRVGAGTEVEYHMEETIILSGLKFTIRDFVAAILPKEEVALLASLGKVEVTPFSEQDSIVCPI